MPNKLFAVSVCMTERKNYGLGGYKDIITHAVTWVEAQSENEAVGVIYKQFQKDYGIENKYDILVVEVPLCQLDQTEQNTPNGGRD
jgi:hypothetical protein